ncbi:MAG: DUF1775 domain-containing protein [Candidatus Cybelea sp.]
MTLRLGCTLCLIALLTPMETGAHVRIFPDTDSTQAPACSFSKFTVRVPVERPVATTRIDVAIPTGIIVYAVQPKPGWRFDRQTSRGVVTKISWTGGRLMPHEFDEFAFLAATPRTPGVVAWNAWQYYSDGVILVWAGPTNSDAPHSVTTITPAHCRPIKKGK